MQKLQPNTRDYRNFSIGTSILFILLAVYAFYKGFDIRLVYGFSGLGVFIFLFAFVYPQIIKPIYFFWMKFAYVLGEVNTRIILFLVFVLTILPIGLLFRLFGKDLLDTKLDNSKDSYWIERDKKEINVDGYFKHF